MKNKIMKIVSVLLISTLLIMPVSAADTANQWVEDSVGWWYKNADGTYPYSCWKLIDDEWYYFNNAGYRVTGWQVVNGNWYYFDKETGVMASDEWVDIYYLTSSGAMATGWQFIDNEWYYCNASGAKVTGWNMIGGVWYYFDASGKMLTDWQTIGGTWYYFNISGAMVTGWQFLENNWYYFNTSGALTTGWQFVSGKWYYMNSDGTMTTGWLASGGVWYYLGNDGAMLSNQWIGDYYVGSNGAMVTDTWVGNYYVDGYGKCVYDQWYVFEIGNGQYAKVLGYFDEYYADQVIQQVNEYRVASGKVALTKHDALTQGAMVRGLEITYSFSHTRPNGEDFYTAIEGESGFMTRGENVAYGFITPSDVMIGWKNSEGHNKNMLEDGHRCIGVACFRARTAYGYVNYWVQLFGRQY